MAPSLKPHWKSIYFNELYDFVCFVVVQLVEWKMPWEIKNKYSTSYSTQANALIAPPGLRFATKIALLDFIICRPFLWRNFEIKNFSKFSFYAENMHFLMSKILQRNGISEIRQFVIGLWATYFEQGLIFCKMSTFCLKPYLNCRI